MTPNVIAVVLDSVRARNLPFHGYPRQTMPVLADLAREGVAFTQAFATSNWSLPSHASLLSGRLPRGHRVGHRHRRLDADVPSLPALLQAAGYRTALFTANPYISDPFGMVRGFEHRFKAWQLIQTGADVTHQHVLEIAGDAPPDASAHLALLRRGNLAANLVNHLYGENLSRRTDAGGRRLLRAAARWLRADRRPFFALFNFMEAHLPYRPPSDLVRPFLPADAPRSEVRALRQNPQTARVNAGVMTLAPAVRKILRALYDGCLRMLDGYLDALVEMLRNRGLHRDTVLIVLSDHGDLLGEGGMLGHEFSIADPLLHVPLVIWGAGAAPGIVTGLVQVHDLFPTALRLAGAEAPDGTDGRDLLAGSPARPFVFAEADRPLVSMRWVRPHTGATPRLALLDRGLATARTTQHKLIVATDGSEALYDVQADPGEERNLAGAPDEPAGVRDDLRRIVESLSSQTMGPAADAEIDDETRRALERFGYLT